MANPPDLFDVTGRVALVTGGTGLLGKEFCRTLAAAGAVVVISDLDQTTVDEYSAQLNKNGCTSCGIPADITQPQAVKALLRKILLEYDKLDILVNSAALDPKFDPQQIGQQVANTFENYPLKAWQQSLDVNLTGMFLCCQEAVKPMLEQGKGVIINLCSMYGLNAPDQRLYQQEGQPQGYKPVSYTTTKAGVLGFTKYLAGYYAGKGIRVNALTPGGVFNGHDKGFVQRYSAHTMLGRMAQKHEMNGALLFLASDASSYMTGANLVVDGGWTAW